MIFKQTLVFTIKQIVWLFFIAIINNTIVHANDDLIKKMNDPANWASWGGNYQGTRYSELDQINADNVHQLVPVWNFPTGLKGNYQGSPLVIDGVIYFHTPNSDQLYAVNLSDQTVKWKADYPLKKIIRSGVKNSNSIETDLTNHGLAYAEGKIFWHRLGGGLEARDAHTGELIWTAQNGSLDEGVAGGTPPLVVGDKVIVGMADIEVDKQGNGVRGYISTYNINKGNLLWRGYSMGTDNDTLINPEKTQTWNNRTMQAVGKSKEATYDIPKKNKERGGVPSGWISYDPELNLIYYGTTSKKPQYSMLAPYKNGLVIAEHFQMVIEGTDRGISSLWARDADTGEVKWLYQMTPNNQWGYDGINESILIEQNIAGMPRKTLVHFDKNGFVYTLDRETGALLKADKFDQFVNWAYEINHRTGQPKRNHHKELVDQIKRYKKGIISEICPSFHGGKPLQPAAYSAKNNLFFMAGSRKCMAIEPGKVQDKYNNSISFLDVYIFSTDHHSSCAENCKGNDAGVLQAWDPNTQRQQWQIIEPYELRTGVLVTQGDVVFYATLDGYFKAVHAKTGERLYTRDHSICKKSLHLFEMRSV